jgi:O-antigen/teichoic acid export membrane protein
LLRMTLMENHPNELTGAAPPDTSSLDRSLVLGVAWTAGMKWLTQVVSWGSTLLVARILTPGDYGVYGMAMFYMGLVAPIYDLGLSAAVIQRRDMTREQVARLGGLSLVYALGFSLLCIAASPAVAAFYRDGRVEPVAIMLSVMFMITAPQMLPRALMARDLEFRKLAWIDGVAAITLMTANLVFALLGFRYWSFVYGGLISAVVTTVLALSWAPHPIAWPSQFRSIRSAATFGWQVAFARVGTYVYSNADFAVVGRALGGAILGAYTFGWTLATIPVDRISSLVERVIPSVLSAAQKDVAALRRYALALSEGLAFIVLPLAVGMSLTADHLVRIALGPNWTGAVGPLRLLAFYGGFRAIATVIAPIIVATGHSRRDLQYTLFAVLVLPPLFFAGSRWGAEGVAAAWAVGFPIVMFPAYRFAFRLLDLRASAYVRALWPAIASSAVMAIMVLTARRLTPASYPLIAQFAIEVVVGAVSYTSVIMLRHGARARAFLALLTRFRGGQAAEEQTGAAVDAESTAPAGAV